MSEADARIIIDDTLRRAGWDPGDRSRVQTEVAIPLDGQAIVDAGARPDRKRGISSGRADYVLYDGRGHALAVVEAKASAIQPYTAKQQALPYAKTLGAPFIFLTNGESIYFWDYTQDDARVINSFYSQRDLERTITLRAERKPLATVPIPDTYLRQGEAREVRPYQQEAMRAIDAAVELGKRRFLLELPTGTGKTDLTCLYLKRLIESRRAERILFLVDREQLALQALEALQELLPRHGSYWLQPGATRKEEQITVCLLQTMISRYAEFSSGYFDVVVADESHRSIYGAWQTALTHFDALQIGLTATPAQYIERNTYRFYGCEDGKPDFSYPITQAFEEGHLVPYKFATGITVLLAQGADADEEHYDPVEFERKWTNAETNRLMMAEFDRIAHECYKDLAPGQKVAPGKAIVFAITKQHAARLAEELNKLHPEHQGRYAEVITSDVRDPDGLIRRFKRPNEMPMVAVSVGMLDTGFDLREVLHLVMCRRVRSPILYQQMRGRGTRTAPHIGKRKFVIYDFFGNHDFFNDSDADVFTGTQGGASRGGGGIPPVDRRDLVELGLDDEWLHAVAYVEVGPGGERVDKRDYQTRWEEAIQRAAADDHILQKVRDNIPLSDHEEQVLGGRLNQPEMYFNEDNLRRAYNRPGGALTDFIRAALGTLKLKTREEELTESFSAWLVTKNLGPQQSQYLTILRNRGIVRGQVSVADLFQPPLSILNAAQLGVELFGQKGLKEIIEEMNDAVFTGRAA